MRKVALVGNPNAGKSSIFNKLTGLSQHVGNYPGVTVDRHAGEFRTSDGKEVQVIDLPGTYSIFPRSEDERVASEILLDLDHADHPDLVAVVVDGTNLSRNLLLLTQVVDLGLPVVLVLNMMDLLKKEGLAIDVVKLSELLGGVKVVGTNARKGDGLEELKEAMVLQELTKPNPFSEETILRGDLSAVTEEEQIADTNTRFKRIQQLLKFCLSKVEDSQSRRLLSKKLDKVMVHPIWGYGIFLAILFLIFQAIYELAGIPQDLIDEVFLVASQWVGSNLPEGVFTSLLAEGIVPGVGGVLIFVPQIALLFAFLAILEESGYMSSHFGGIRLYV